MGDIQWAVGMKVALTEGYNGLPVRRTVKRITPSGMAVVAGVSEGSERKFDKFGRERGRTGGYWGKPRIEPWTADHDQKIADSRRERLLREIAGAMRSLDSYPLEEIMSAVSQIRTERLASKSKQP